MVRPCLLPDLPPEVALARAEAWRHAVASLSVVHGNFPSLFAILLAAAVYPEHGKTPEELTRCVDQSLYRAKRERRNRVAGDCP